MPLLVKLMMQCNPWFLFSPICGTQFRRRFYFTLPSRTSSRRCTTISGQPTFLLVIFCTSINLPNLTFIFSDYCAVLPLFPSLSLSSLSLSISPPLLFSLPISFSPLSFSPSPYPNLSFPFSLSHFPVHVIILFSPTLAPQSACFPFSTRSHHPCP